ncbi:hypothetical protein DFH09DRAFT_1073315 [Mycena vulgaris]|nr:hypothetical protein DFH09DRAFT_1073315 [Mycena vulgaris]
MSIPSFLSRPTVNRLILYTLLIQVTLSVATVFERTMDDASGDSLSGVLPIYVNVLTPTDGEHELHRLPGGLAPSVTLSFTGTAIPVFCILANTVPDAITTSDFSFTLDGTPMATFLHVPDSSSEFIYGLLVFSVDGLGRGPHKLDLVARQ